ncbi:MAG: 50S ribosomal protein L29 [Halobacteriovoraceae bacterium]|jgi:large subunit ribosomal protein L29|nr:50S ribosomal protein L29 [Halobacteriovoraceae bacterium]
MADMMKFAEVKDMDVASLDAKVSEIKREIFNLKMEKATSGLEKPHRLRVLKKNIAKLMTAKTAQQKK